jgi:uncharacterized protein (DUF1919 family)
MQKTKISPMKKITTSRLQKEILKEKFILKINFREIVSEDWCELMKKLLWMKLLVLNRHPYKTCLLLLKQHAWKKSLVAQTKAKSTLTLFPIKVDKVTLPWSDSTLEPMM